MIRLAFPRRLIAALLLVTGLSGQALAAPSDKAAQFVQAMGDSALTIIQDKALSQSVKQKKLEGIFSQNVDVAWIGKFVLGRFWRTASDAQRTRYMKEYDSFLVTRYTSRFAKYTDGKFTLTGSKPDGDGYVVTMEITPPKEDTAVVVDYRVHPTPQGLRIFDVIVEGVSLVTTQRSEFNSVISDKGLDYLIDQLAKKVAE